MNSAAKSSNVDVAVLSPCFEFFGLLEIELLDHMVILCLTFLRATGLFSTVGALFYLPTSGARGLQFFHTHANTCFLFL